jgi:MutS-like protein
VSAPRAEYERRLADWAVRIARLDRAHLNISNLRLMVFGLIVFVAWFALARSAISAWWILGPAAAFGALLVFHARVLNRWERARRASRLYERGLDRLAGRWSGVGPDGSRFLDDHPYARDLDLFGPASLFQLINASRTEAGEDTLAEWLRAGAAVEEVRARQAAVDELRSRLDFREDVAVLAAEGSISRTGAVAKWAAAPPVGIGPMLPVVLGVCAAALVALVAAAWQDLVPWSLVLLWLLVEAAIVRVSRRWTELVAARVGKPADDLAIMAELLARIEREPLSAQRLRRIAEALESGGVRASTAIARLTKLVSLRESSMHNLFFMPLTSALLLPDQLAVAIDRWHATHGPAVVGWLRAVGELEALSSFATHAYEHPGDPFPALVDGAPLFEARAIGHPLMLEGVSVRNDVSLGGSGIQLIVVSGSNMSGKSTLLRSIGTNVVLALAGATVRADAIRLSSLAIGATLRIEDSLQAGRSRFYTEILRIRAIVEIARGPVPLLFLLDEILHGTNSYDRRIGAEGIVRALAGLGAIGLITTHDLALTELPSQLGPAAVNMHFEDRLEGGTMVFDYRMRPGVVEHSNALALMRAIGLDV